METGSINLEWLVLNNSGTEFFHLWFIVSTEAINQNH